MSDPTHAPPRAARAGVGLSDHRSISPTNDEWNEWATFSNHVTDACRDVDLCHPLLFSQRKAIAGYLWDLGYRPTRDQIAEMSRRHREVDEARKTASDEPAEWEREFLDQHPDGGWAALTQAPADASEGASGAVVGDGEGI